MKTPFRAGRFLPNEHGMPTARPIEADELDELLDLYRILDPDDGYDEDEGTLYEQWERIVDDDRVDMVVVDHDDRLVATRLLSVTPNLTRGARPFAVVENVDTHEDYRDDGFGKLVLEKARELAEERNCYEIMLLTGTEKKWKLDFYESCGFDPDRKTALEMDLR